MAKIELEFTLKGEDYDSIIDTAGYGVGYWASYMYSTDKGCHFTEEESGKKFFITREALEKAVAELYAESPLNDYYMSSIRELVETGQPGSVGSDIADAIVQQACFGKVIYG